MFQYQKKELSDNLFRISTKISFPKKLLENLNSANFGDISKCMKIYNKNIAKAKKMYIDLESITEWGFFTNSYFFWNFSVRQILSDDRSNTLDVLGSLKFDISFDNPIGKISNKILSQSNIKISNLLTFMSVHKYEQTYYFETFDFEQNTFIKSQISLDTILKLLPVCLIIDQDKNINDCYNPIQTLDMFDIINKDVKIELK